MQIIIPMAGMGDRFVRRGYTVPKPLIKVDGKPIIKHVVELFPGESDFLFICNNTHLAETNIKDILRDCAPGCEIVGIKPHKKGPVYTVIQAKEKIISGEIIVNYCDFGMYWNYEKFLQEVRDAKVDGSIPSYRGFHPHMLRSLNYAFIKEKDNMMLEIREKEPFTDNRMGEYASAGTYYFKDGELSLKYFDELMKRGISTNGEYYVSMVYNLMVGDGKQVSVHEIENMLQWGTPEELEAYCKWSEYFMGKQVDSSEMDILKGSMIMPMAGSGRRFQDEGYSTLKPLIEIGEKKMFEKAVVAAPPTRRKVFVCLARHLQQNALQASIDSLFPEAKVAEIDSPTYGQAETCCIGIEGIEDGEPIHIVSCDNAPVWNYSRFIALIEDEAVDAVIWCFKNNIMAAEKPEMYGWVRADEGGRVKEVKVKEPISSDPYNDYGITGAFYFKSAALFKHGYEKLVKENRKVNGEYYVDGVVSILVEEGYNVRVFQVDNQISFGTPSELKTYEYWNDYFKKISRKDNNKPKKT